MALFHCQLDILRIMVAAADDNDVFASAGDKEFALPDKAQIPCAHEWSCAGVSDMRLEGLCRGLRMSPVSLGNAGPCDPDFADVSGLAGEMCVRVNDHELLVGEDATTTYELLSCATRGRCEDGVMLLKGCFLDCLHYGSSAFLTAGDHEGCFCETVAGRPCLTTETTGSKGSGEAFQGVWPYRLCTIESDFPTAQIERGALLRGDLAHAQLIGKIGATAARSLVTGNGPATARGAVRTPSVTSGHREAGIQRC